MLVILPDFMSNILPFPAPTTNCLRCGEVCRSGPLDTKKRAIRQAKEGFCPACMITKFLLSIEPIRDLFEGTARTPAKLGPEIFLNDVWREKVLSPLMAGLLAHTQLPADSIDWLKVSSNWCDPWPKGREPQFGNF